MPPWMGQKKAAGGVVESCQSSATAAAGLAGFLILSHARLRPLP
jgi:hypothetical protein